MKLGNGTNWLVGWLAGWEIPTFSECTIDMTEELMSCEGTTTDTGHEVSSAGKQYQPHDRIAPIERFPGLENWDSSLT